MSVHRKFDFRNFHFAGEEGALIPALQRVQQEDGYISRERMEEIHRATGIPLPQIYGVATFYAQFRLNPIGKHLIKVCHGTACHVAGAEEITETVEGQLGVVTGETTKDRLYTLETVSCLGCCSLAPVITIGDATFGNLAPNQVKKIIKQHREAAAKDASEGKAQE